MRREMQGEAERARQSEAGEAGEAGRGRERQNEAGEGGARRGTEGQSEAYIAKRLAGERQGETTGSGRGVECGG